MSNESPKISIIINWIISVFCLFLTLGAGFNISGIILLFVGIASMPIKKIDELWAKIFKKNTKLIKILMYLSEVLIFPSRQHIMQQPLRLLILPVTFKVELAFWFLLWGTILLHTCIRKANNVIIEPPKASTSPARESGAKLFVMCSRCSLSSTCILIIVTNTLQEQTKNTKLLGGLKQNYGRNKTN